MEAVGASEALAHATHPLDTYVSQHLSPLAAAGVALIFAHVTEPAPFPIQRLAEQVGLAALSPSHLTVHPEHGPWIALRAVVLADVDGPPPAQGRPPSPCASCAAPCVPALERALAVSGRPLDIKTISLHANDWIAVRDACPIGRGSRYGEAQLDYHYSRANRKLSQGS
jgi:methylmalonic aciduria homocystinuria type C protein